MSLENYCLNIPCKTYIAKYLYSIYGYPFDLNLKNNFNDEIISRLHHEPLKKLPANKLDYALFNLDSEIKFRIPIDFFYRIDRSLSKNKIWNINRYLVNSFNDDLLWTVNIGAAFSVERRTTIESFSNKYGIILEEDITYEALKKSEYRLRQSESFRNKFLATLSSPLHVTLRT